MTKKQEFYDAAKNATVERSTSLDKSVRGIGHQMRTSIETATELDEHDKINELLKRLDSSERSNPMK